MQASPLVSLVVLLAILALISLMMIFNICMARLFTVYGAVALNVGLFWLVLRLIVRILVFPGSIVFWQRSTEQSYRIEMAKQFNHHLEQLRSFLSSMTPHGMPANFVGSVTAEGAWMGCMVIQSLHKNFHAQVNDQVKFSKEQEEVKGLVDELEKWLNTAKVMERRNPGRAADTDAREVPLKDWLQRMVSTCVPVPLSYASANNPLSQASQVDIVPTIGRVEQLINIFESLQQAPDGCCATVWRFISVPTVGSLHQLRAELLMRYSGRQCWVRNPRNGRRIDGMFIACPGAELDIGPEDSVPSPTREDIPLKDLQSMSDGRTPGPVVVWCNPNAGYYETMAYESQGLDFYISQGCSVFVWNYSGFGRSEGAPTPSAVAQDGAAVLEFLRRCGITQVLVHGRSIGGIAACSLAEAFPDLVKVLVADRTFSTLGRTARFTFGNWAQKGLLLTATWADNVQCFLGARCYKVMMCDPKDMTIPDLAALRSAVAQKTLEKAPESEKFVLEPVKAQKLAEAWAFFDILQGVCDREGAAVGPQCRCCRAPEPKRSARQPVLGKPAPEPGEVDLENGEESQRLMASGRARTVELKHTTINFQWLEEHQDIVQNVMGPHIEKLRKILEHVGTQFNAAGMTLDDALARPQEEAAEALQILVANLQVWGAVGNLNDPASCAGTVLDKELETLLARGTESRLDSMLSARLRELSAKHSPDSLADYHRRLGRSLVLLARKAIMQMCNEFNTSLAPSANSGEATFPGQAQLLATVVGHLSEVEGFVSALGTHFARMNSIRGVSSPPPYGGPAASPTPPTAPDLLGVGVGVEAAQAEVNMEAPPGPASQPPPPDGQLRPMLDRSFTGYLVTLDCGHNGLLGEGELHQLAMHLKHAGFGKYKDNPNIPAGRGAGAAWT